MKQLHTLKRPVRVILSVILAIIFILTAGVAITSSDCLKTFFLGLLPACMSGYVFARLNCDYYGEQWGK